MRNLLDGIGKKASILGPRDLATPKACQVRGEELGVEQAETARVQPVDREGKRDL